MARRYPESNLKRGKCARRKSKGLRHRSGCQLRRRHDAGLSGRRLGLHELHSDAALEAWQREASFRPHPLLQLWFCQRPCRLEVARLARGLSRTSCQVYSSFLFNKFFFSSFFSLVAGMRRTYIHRYASRPRSSPASCPARRHAAYEGMHHG